MRKMSEDEKMEKLAELREDAIMLEKDFFEGGREAGLEEKTKEIVKKMLSKNMDIEEISEITGLTKIEIEKIGKEK